MLCVVGFFVLSLFTIRKLDGDARIVFFSWSYSCRFRMYQCPLKALAQKIILANCLGMVKRFFLNPKGRRGIGDVVEFVNFLR
jgi:hypothetical protein